MASTPRRRPSWPGVMVILVVLVAAAPGGDRVGEDTLVFHIHVLGGGEAGGLEVAVTAADERRSDRVSADGTVSLAAERAWRGQPLVVEVTDPGPDTARVHPARWTLAPDPRGPVHLVVFPTTWRVDRGRFKGTTVPLRPAEALGLEAPREKRFLHHPSRRWPDHRFPLTVVWEDDVAQSGPADADLERLAEYLDGLNDALGWEAFRLGSPPRRPVGSVATADVEARLGARNAARAVPCALPDDGCDPGRGFVRGVMILTEAALRSAWVTHHEFLHVLGYGHTCAWDSALWTPAPPDCRRVTGTPRSAPEGITPGDVAHIHMHRELVALVASLDAPRLVSPPLRPELATVPWPFRGLPAPPKPDSDGLFPQRAAHGLGHVADLEPAVDGADVGAGGVDAHLE